ncbi:hypothetical protein Vretifemale_5136, partial [Volvox reticuliferus]
PGQRRAPLLLEAGSKGAPPPLLQPRGHGRAPESLIPGFLPSRSSSTSGVVVCDYFPPPEVPPQFSGSHTFPPGLRAGALRVVFAASASGDAAGSAQHQQGAATTAASLGAPPPPPPPEVPPPSDPGLRREVDVLAAIVARSGPALEQIARKQAISAASAAAKSAATGNAGVADFGAGAEAVKGGTRIKYSFFVDGNGLDYYLWRLHKIQTALAAVHAGPQPHVPPGVAGAAMTQPEGSSNATGPAGSAAQRPKHLTMEQRMVMLGEQPLPATAATVSSMAAGSASASAGAPPPRRQVAEADRQHLQALLNSNFVRGENQYLSNDSEAAPVGLRLGGKQAAAAAEAAAAFLSRFTGGSSSETAVLQPDGAGGLQQQQKGSKDAESSKEGGIVASRLQEPVRTVEDWRPEPLLCKRFNVPDPYKGKPRPQQVSRFRTDLLALPETSNLVISPTATTAAQATVIPGLSQKTLGASIPPPPPLAQIVNAQATATSASLMAAELPAAAVPRVPLVQPAPAPPGAKEAHFPPPPPLPTRRDELHGANNLPPPPPRWGPQHPINAVAPPHQLPQAAGQPSGNPQLGGPSAADAASAFLSILGQSINAPTGDGGGGTDGAASPLPLPPAVILAPVVDPSGGLCAQLPLTLLPPPPLAATASATVLGTPSQVLGQTMLQQPPQPSQEEDLVVVPLDKPLDLFAAIFEAGSDEEEEHDDEKSAGVELTKQTGDAGNQDDRSGPAAAAGKSDVAIGSTKSLAEALMRVQVSNKQEDRQSRQGVVLQQKALAGVGAEEAAGGTVQAAGGIIGPVDSEVQERIRAALSLFQRHHRNKDRDKDRKRKKKDKGKQKDKKDKKDKKRKDKDGDHDDGGRSGKKSRKERRRSERKTKKGKKEKGERKDRRERKSAKRRRSERDGDDDDGAHWEEPRSRGRSKEAEDKSSGKKRIRHRSHSRSSSSSPGKDDRPRRSQRHIDNGAPAPIDGSLTGIVGRHNDSATRITRGNGDRGRIDDLGGGPDSNSDGGCCSSETGDDSSSNSSEGDSDCSSESQ